jgi:Flp pilus assembly protein TadG
MGWALTGFRTMLRTRAARFAQARGGAAAVEFALMAVPFFLLLFGVIELALIFLLSTTMDNAAGEVGRRIRTGELQTQGGATPAAFKTAICDTLGWLKGDCESNLYVDVQTFDSFQTANEMDAPVNNGAFDPSQFGFNLGQPGSIVVVRAFYKWPFMTPLVSKAMGQFADGSTVLVSTVTFKNEPYAATAPPAGA